MTSASLGGLSTSLDACIYHLEQAIRAVQLARADGQSAAGHLGTTSDGSANELLAEGLTACAAADQDLESIEGLYTVVADKIREYKVSKGLA